MVDYMNAVKKPFSDLKNLAIGGIVSIIPLANLLSMGNAIENGKTKKLEVMKMDDLVKYLINSIMVFVISIIYMIIPIIVLAIGGASMVMGALGGEQNMAAVSAGLAAGGPIMLVGGLLYIIAVLLLPMAIGKWLKAGNLGASLKVMDVVKNVLTADYIITLIVLWVYMVVLMIIAMILGVILAFIPFVGPILMLVVMGCAMYAGTITAMTMIVETVK